jgi:hypothetical protein
MRLIVPVLLLAVSCTAETRPDPRPGKIVPAQLVGCAIDAPSGKTAVDMSAEFQVDAHGRVRDIHIQGGGVQAKALKRHLESCEYAPATKDGRPFATRRAAVFSGYR